MLQFSEISINDRDIFDKYLSNERLEASEMNFTNFFMWRGAYNFRYAEVHDHLCIVAVPKEGKPYAMLPIGDGDKTKIGLILNELLEYFNSKGWEFTLKRVEESKLAILKAVDTLELIYEEDRDNSDYLYLSSSLINLKGKKYDGKRNHINKFKKTYSYEYKTVTSKEIDDCGIILEKWCSERSCDEHSDFNCEKIANYEVLKNFDKLNVKGAIVYVDGRPEAFSVGERINDNTAVIHIEKANSTVNGLYTFINQQFCENEWNSMEYINREQDLGIEGLRKAKLSYNPVSLVNKYTVKLK